MALFKIFKNISPSNRLPTTYHEGYCYFDIATNKFYIDTTDTAAGRVPINALRANVADVASQITFGTCTTAGNVQNKIVVVDKPVDIIGNSYETAINDYPARNIDLGFMLAVYFEHANTVDSPYITLQLNDGTHSLPLGTVYCNASTPAEDTEFYSWGDGALVILTLVDTGKVMMADWKDPSDMLDEWFGTNWSDIGSDTNPIYFNNNGYPEASIGNVGSASQPLYMDGGELTEIDYDLENFVTHDDPQSGSSVTPASNAYLPLTGGNVTGNITSHGSSSKLVFSYLNGESTTNSGDLYLNYDVAAPIHLGTGGTYTISANGSQYSGNAATATSDSNGNNIVNTYVPFFVDHHDPSDLNDIVTSGFHRVNSPLTNKPTGANDYGQLIVSCGSDTITQIYSDYGTGDLYTRSGNPLATNGTAAWTSWKRLLTNSDANNYVTLDTAQTISGIKTLTSSLYFSAANDRIVAFDVNNSGTNMDIGWNWTNMDGAGLALRGSDFTNDSGSFYLYARDSVGTTARLSGTTAGNLTWEGGDLTIRRTTSIANNYPARIVFTTIQSDNSITSGGNTGCFIAAYDDHDTYNYGCNLVIQGNDNLILGSGESAINFYNAELVDSSAENVHITADGSINFWVNCNTIANRVRAAFVDNTAFNFYKEQRLWNTNIFEYHDNAVRRGTTPSANYYKNYGFRDQAGKTISYLESGVLTNGQSNICLTVMGHHLNSEQYGKFILYKTLNNTGNYNCTYNANTGELTATKVWGAVWNDYAEYRETKEDIQPGRCIKETGKGDLILTSKRLEEGCEIVSDTFGFAIGKSEQCQTPTAAVGRVLAYLYEEPAAARPGQPVCSGPNGTVSLMTNEEAREYPWCIIGTISEIPDYDEWLCGGGPEGSDPPAPIQVDGRVWIRVR